MQCEMDIICMCVYVSVFASMCLSMCMYVYLCVCTQYIETDNLTWNSQGSQFWHECHREAKYTFCGGRFVHVHARIHTHMHTYINKHAFHREAQIRSLWREIRTRACTHTCMYTYTYILFAGRRESTIYDGKFNIRRQKRFYN